MAGYPQGHWVARAMTEAEARYIKRLPGQLAASLRKTRSLLNACNRYGMTLEDEAQMLLRSIYGDTNPGQAAELEYQIAMKNRK